LLADSEPNAGAGPGCNKRGAAGQKAYKAYRADVGTGTSIGTGTRQDRSDWQVAGKEIGQDRSGGDVAGDDAADTVPATEKAKDLGQVGRGLPSRQSQPLQPVVLAEVLEGTEDKDELSGGAHKSKNDRSDAQPGATTGPGGRDVTDKGRDWAGSGDGPEDGFERTGKRNDLDE